MSRYILILCLSVMGCAFQGCTGGCPNSFARADTLMVVGSLPDFDSHRPCGGTDGECWAIGEVVVTYADGATRTWTETLGRREFFIRSASLSKSGAFDWNLHEPQGNAFTEENEVKSISYRIELVNRFSEGRSEISVRTGICFDGTVQSEQRLPPEQDPFVLPQERRACDVSRRAVIKVEAQFARSSNCPS